MADPSPTPHPTQVAAALQRPVMLVWVSDLVRVRVRVRVRLTLTLTLTLIDRHCNWSFRGLLQNIRSLSS